MTPDQTLAFETDCHLFHDCGYPAPSLFSFEFKPLFTIGPVEFNKPMLMALIATVFVLGFFWLAFGKAKVVPGKLQMVAELGYDFVRRGIAREVVGKEGERYVPLLVSLFFLVWSLNIWAIVPFGQIPVTSMIGYPVALAGVVWIIYMTLTFQRAGFVGGIRKLCVPSGLPRWIYFLLTPVEFLSNVFVRPFTLAVRLFGNMFAGHVLILVFTIAAWYTLGSVIGTFYSVTSLAVTLVLTGFEMFIQALQAYVFTVLTATYIAGALEEAH